jgi:hypothetical protein
MSFLEGYKGAGSVSLQLIVNGARSGGLIDAGNINSLVLAAVPETGEIISRRKGSAGNVLDTVNTRVPLKVTWKGNTFFRKIWDMLLMGTATDFSAATITDEPATALVLDEWVPFGDRSAFPGHTLSALTDSAGTTTYVLNTDYEYRQADGAIKYLSTGAITLNDALLGDLTAPATGYAVALNAVTENKVRMLVDGENEFNGRATFLELYQVSNKPNSSPDMLAGEIQEYEFEGSCEVPEWTTVPGMWYYKD